MSNLSLQEQIEQASAYQDSLVPALLAQWAPRVADAAMLRPGDHVLDVACGTGVLARQAASRVAPAGTVAGLDANDGMLAVALNNAPTVRFRRGVAEALPYPDRTFSAVVSQFGLMFFDDRDKAVREMLRVLVPGGRLAVAVWASLDASPGFAAEVALLERCAGTAAADALRAPYALGDRDALVTLFERGGASAVKAVTCRGTARFDSVRTMVEGDLRGWLPIMGVSLSEDVIDRVIAEAEHALVEHVDAEGRPVFEVAAHVVTASRL